MNDILESINRIDFYTQGIDYDSFLLNQMLIDAVIRNLEVNILIHQHFGIDESIVWEVIKINLPEIKPMILKVIQEAGDIT